MKSLSFRLFFTVLLILLFSCSGSPPSLINSEWMIVYTKDFSRGGIYKELNFFAQVDDNDGIEDVAEISIHRDDLGWAWYLESDNWVSYSADGENWLGANGLTRGGELPEGEYRLLIVDRSGQRNESFFEVGNPGIDSRRLTYPEVQIENDFIRVFSGSSEAVVLWFYSDKGDLVAEKYSRPGYFHMDEILSAEEKQISSWIMVYYQDEKRGFGVKSGPFLMNGNGSVSPLR